MPRKAQSDHARRTVTCYDVARHAGVSQSSVSRSFHPDGKIARHTRARVLAAAAELGYRPNALAQGLITRRSNLIAVLIPNLTNLTYPEMLFTLTGQLSQHGMRALLFTLDGNVVPDEVLEQVWRYRVDGAIAIAKLTPDQVLSFGVQHVPLVLYNRWSEVGSIGAICCDSIGGEAVLVDGLIAAGHRRFGMIAGPEDSEVAAERMVGTLRQLEAAGLVPVAVTRGNYDYASGRAGYERLIAEAGSLDAIVCGNDFMAIGAIDAARARGIDVPAALSIVGFDGVGAVDWDAYQLTTIRQPVSRMVSSAVAMLINRIADPDQPSERRTFTGKLERGASARIRI